MGKFMLYTITMLFILSGFGFVTHVDSDYITAHDCLQARNSTVNTTYKSNLKTLLDSLAKNVPLQNGIFNTSVGNGSDQVYGLAWCRAEISPHTCSECLNDAISMSLKDCPGSKTLVMWSSLCSLRFANDSVYGQLWDSSSTSSGDGLDKPWVFLRGFSMMQSLAGNVSNQPLMFNTDVVDVGSDGKRYGFGQCSPDLSKMDCDKCLGDLLRNSYKLVLNQTSWELRAMSCGLWYDFVRFYNDGPAVSKPIASGSGEKGYNGDVTLAFVALLVFHWI